MYKNALLIYNGNAGQEEMDKILGNITPILTKGIDNLTLAQTKNAGDAENIAKEKGRDYELVISLGGDGTLHEVINGLGAIKKPPIVGVLPGGTCNDFARGLNMPIKLEDAAGVIIKGQTKDIDIGKVNNRYFTNFVGTGLITDISENVNPNTKNIMGRISYYTSAIRSMSDRKPFKFTLKTEKEKIKDSAAMVIIVNGNHVGSKCVPVKSISMTDGYFDVFILYDTGLSLIMRYLTNSEQFEEKIGENQIKHIKAKEIKLETKERLSLDTDGEVYLKTPIKVNVCKNKLKFIVG